MKKFIIFLLALAPFFVSAQQKELSKEAYIERVKNNPDSINSLVDLRRVGGYTPEYAELNPLFKTLSPKVRKSKEGKEFRSYLKTLNSVSVGKKAKYFSQKDTAGNTVALKDFKGRYVLLDFWASWCPDCRVQSPELVKTYAEFKGPNFEIIGISFDKDRGSWIKAIHTDQLYWTQLSDLKRWQNEVGTLYGVKSIPQNVLISPEGIIVARNIHGEELNTLLRKLVKK